MIQITAPGSVVSGGQYTSQFDRISAKDSDGLKITDDTYQLGIFIEDGGAVRFGGKLIETIKSHGTISSGTETFDLDDGTYHTVTVGGDFILAFDNWPATGLSSITIKLTNAGAYTITWPGAVDWQGAEPSWSETGNDFVLFFSDDNGVTIYGQTYNTQFDKISARDSDGLKITDDGDNLGIFVKDGGHVGVNTLTPSAAFDVNSESRFRDSMNITDGTDTTIIKHVQEPGLGGRLTFGLDETARTMVICDAGDVDSDFSLGAAAAPSLVLFSAAGIAPTVIDNTQVSIYDGNVVLDASGVWSNYSFSFSIKADQAAGDMYIFKSNTNIEVTDTNGEQSWLYIEPKINQSATAAYNALKIDVTETALGDGTTGDGNNLIRASVGGATKFKVDNAGRVTLLQLNEPAAPTLSFGDGDTGLYQRANNIISVSSAGSNEYEFSGASFQGMNATGPKMYNAGATATTATFRPNKSDGDTGIGHAGIDQLSLIAGGVEGIRITENGDDITVNLFLTIDSVTISDGGTGYAAGTLVLTGGGGTGAAGTYTVAGGIIDSTTITNHGTGYTSAPTVTPSDAGNGDAVLATVARTSQLVLPQHNDAATPTLAFGDGDTGIYEAGANMIGFATGGTLKGIFTGSMFTTGQNAAHAGLANAMSTSTVPAHTFYADGDTGIGRAAADQLSLIAGGVEGIRITENGGPIYTTNMGGQVAHRTTSAGNYNPSTLTSDYIIGITNTVAARAVTISTEDENTGSIDNPRVMIIKDESGGAAAHNITVTLESSNTIDGSANYVINQNYQSITLSLIGSAGFII